MMKNITKQQTFRKYHLQNKYLLQFLNLVKFNHKVSSINKILLIDKIKNYVNSIKILKKSLNLKEKAENKLLFLLKKFKSIKIN